MGFDSFPTLERMLLISQQFFLASPVICGKPPHSMPCFDLRTQADPTLHSKVLLRSDPFRSRPEPAESHAPRPWQ